MNNFTKTFSSMIHSSIWREDDQTRILWITLLVMADRDGEVHGADVGLADAAKIPIDAFYRGIEKLMGPDPNSKSNDSGERIVRIEEGGFRILNYEKYSNLMTKEQIRDKARTRQQRFRDRHLNIKNDSSDESELVNIDETNNKNNDTNLNLNAGANIDDFEEFWKITRRKEAKAQSRKAFKAAVKKIKLPELIKAWKAYNDSKATTEPRFILLPSTWLNGERWGDEVTVPGAQPEIVREPSGTIRPAKYPSEHWG